MSSGRCGSKAITRIPSPCAFCATTRPMLPSPTTPSVRFESSIPVNAFFSHLPAFIEAVACGMWRASAISNAIACSAVVTLLPDGVLMTTTPRSVAHGQVDVVDADPGAAHDAQLRRRLEDLARDLGATADHQPVGFADLLEQHVGRKVRRVLDLDAARVFEDLGPCGARLSLINTRGMRSPRLRENGGRGRSKVRSTNANGAQIDLKSSPILVNVSRTRQFGGAAWGRQRASADAPIPS